MTSASAIEWRATNLVALGEELQSKVARVSEQFDQRARSARNPDEASRLRQRLGQLVESIQTSYRDRLERMSENGSERDHSLYDHSLAGIDMDRLVYRGDRKALAELLADASFSSTVNRLLAELKPHNARKELLTARAQAHTRDDAGPLPSDRQLCEDAPAESGHRDLRQPRQPFQRSVLPAGQGKSPAGRHELPPGEILTGRARFRYRVTSSVTICTSIRGFPWTTFWRITAEVSRRSMR